MSTYTWEEANRKSFFSFNSLHNHKKFVGILSDVNWNMERTLVEKVFYLKYLRDHKKFVSSFANVNRDTERDSIEKKVFFIQFFSSAEAPTGKKLGCDVV